MNRKPIIFLISIFILTSFTIKEKSFEGIITYKTEIRFKKENIQYREYFEQKFGDTLKVFYNENGDIF